MRLLFALALAVISSARAAEPTLRLDYFHTGDAETEVFSVDELVIEPLPWAGNLDRPLDPVPLGKYLLEVRAKESDRLLYSRSFSSIYGEWETTEEATRVRRSFHESVRFPRPPGEFRVVFLKRDANNEFQSVWEAAFDPADYMHHRETAAYGDDVIAIELNGDPTHKVDLLLLGDGYTLEEREAFVARARALTAAFFATWPFSKRREDFNVWALAPAAAESGISRPSEGIYRDSPLGTRYDAFRSERYVLTFDNKAWRRVASSAPYDAVEILVNHDTYGGGGIYGLYSTAAAGSEWAEYLFIHEFGHHFAGLADEYFTSEVAYRTPEPTIEPYEPNVTALLDPSRLKWAHLVTEGTAVPTPWPQQAYEEHALEYQAERRRLRAEKRPEAEMNALFRANQEFVEELFAEQDNHAAIGAFEGAYYHGKGYYRPAMNCLMFTRTKHFCRVCGEAIERMIDLYTSSDRPRAE